MPMKLTRILLGLGAVLLVGGVAVLARRAEAPGVTMTAAAQRFLDTLTADQKAKTVIPFDSKERTNWQFVPLQTKDRQPTRKGLGLTHMTEPQRKAALALVASGTSERGHRQALTIMSLEAILHDLEKNGAMVRNPEWYFFTVFGNPSKTGKWGWRVEGHHLSLNYVVEGGQVVAATPAFFGANPATIKGPVTGKLEKGFQTLSLAENLARELVLALDADQQKVARLGDKAFPEPRAGTAEAGVGPPQGLAAAKMNEKQKNLLLRLVQAYAERMPANIAAEQMKQVRGGGIENIHFAFTGGTSPGQPHSYRVQGPAFVIEFLNVQSDSAGNPANHIHSVWRNLKGDFGLAPG
jgi:hypothetical protein